MQELREDIELDLEIYKIDAIEKSPRRFEGHNMVDLKVSPRREARMVPAGTLMVRTAQPLGTLAVYLLEPRSEDGLATWNFFDAELKARGRFPGDAADEIRADFADNGRSATGDRRDRRDRSRSTHPAAEAAAACEGASRRRQRWLDGEHWLAVREGRLMKVHAATGRSQPFVDAEGAGQGPGATELARCRHRAIDRRPDLVRHGPRPAGIPVRERAGPLLRDIRWLAGGSPDERSRTRAVPAVQPRRQVDRLCPRF